VDIVGCGVVFSITPSGQETVLHAFTGAPDGSEPSGGLVLNPTTGLAYGVTNSGGTGTNGSGESGGTAYSINLTTGDETVLYNFTSDVSGYMPNGPLVMDPAGNLYGTAVYNVGDEAGGRIVKLTPTGEESALFDFYGLDGSAPEGALAMDASGNLYGTAEWSALRDNGTVFEFTAAGQFIALHSFTGAGTDGANPYVGVTLGPNGVLYGTTYNGGRYGVGTVFQITLPTGTYSTLYSFRGFNTPDPDGQHPWSPVILGPTGILYGETLEGGKEKGCTEIGVEVGCGEIFQIVP
jgi:uncharacterized repeat protein (TIGR03803 family)